MVLIIDSEIESEMRYKELKKRQIVIGVAMSGILLLTACGKSENIVTS